MCVDFIPVIVHPTITTPNPLREALVKAEAALGNNLVWITDKVDLEVRQQNPETLQRLKELEEGWKAVVAALARP